jgi:hypothetical protein
MTAPLLHIGYHKAASTLLQQKLFMMQEIGFFPTKAGRAGIQAAFVTPHALDPAPTDLIDSLHREQDEAAAQNGTLVISHERLSGYPASGGFDQGMIAERLVEAFPQAKVVIFIREQKDILASMYLQTLSDGSTLPLRRFLDPPEPALLRKPCFRLGFYDYDRLIAKYHALFRAGNVLVIPFEAFRGQTEHHARALTAFAIGPGAAARLDASALTAAVNKTRPIACQALRRQINRLVRNQLNENGLLPIPNLYVEHAFRKALPLFEPLRLLDPLFTARIRARVAAACTGRYGASNARVQQMTGLDLAALGYEVSA